MKEPNISVDSVLVFRVYNHAGRAKPVGIQSGGILKGNGREPESSIGLMGVLQSQFGDITRRLIAVGLVLWLGGAACLLGCEAGMSAMTVDSSQVLAPAESCEWGAGRDCCHRAEEESGKAFVGIPSSTSDALMCSPLAGHSAVAASKSSFDDAPAVTLSVRAFLPVSPEGVLVASTERDVHVPDRGGTYLRCCVFLI